MGEKTRVRKPTQQKVPMENHHRSQQMDIHVTVGLHTTARCKRVGAVMVCSKELARNVASLAQESRTGVQAGNRCRI